MKIEETESTITFHEIPTGCLDSFKNMDGELLFIEGIVNDGLFTATFTAPSFEALNIDDAPTSFKSGREVR